MEFTYGSGDMLLLFASLVLCPLSLLLDVFLQNTVLERSEQGLTREELMKQNGIKRKRGLLNRFASSDFFWPLFLFFNGVFSKRPELAIPGR